MGKHIAIVWENSRTSGQVRIYNGNIINIKYFKDSTSWNKGESCSAAETYLRIEVEVDFELQPNTGQTLVTIETMPHSFSFFVSDVNSNYPIYIPAYGAAVTDTQDTRTYLEIKESIEEKGLLTNLQIIEAEKEESFEAASMHTRDHACPTWLGISRDTRIFETQARGRGSNNSLPPPIEGSELQWDWVQPREHGNEVALPENEGRPVRYCYMLGRGIGCSDTVIRRLDKGVLPILSTKVVDDDITYEALSFVSLESSELNSQSLKGTPYLIADGYGIGHMLSADQIKRRDELLAQELETRSCETTVFYCRVIAENSGKVPRYAWFKNIVPNPGPKPIPYTFEGFTGFAQYTAERIFCISKLNGKALPSEENAVLLKPGESAIFEFYLPHQPISYERAVNLSKQDFHSRYVECRDYWEKKLSSSAQIRIPEPRLEEMVQAGLLHTDLIMYGKEPEGTLVPAIGIYTAIGSESSPIIQFMDSMGWGGISRRALMFFLDKQYEDGMIQNYGGYMLETGAVLWCLGEHYRYSPDDSWIAQIKPKLLKAYEFLLRWRQRNETEQLRGCGYGMLEGKTADPEDPYHSFMLNGYAYLGLSRLAELLKNIDEELSSQVRLNADLLKADIRTAFDLAMSRSPVVPLGDGGWVPTAPPWVEARGPLALYVEQNNWFTHGTFMGRDSMLGPMYLIFQEVIEAKEIAADFLVQYHNELMLTRNVAFSQPYYSVHPWVHLKRGEVKPFLKAYYNTVSGLADRETYTFWEHFYQVSPHKTHEEAWFLMQTRWMLYMEEGTSLRLLPGIPRKWLEQGKRIELSGVNTYFGKLFLHVRSELDQGFISATIICDPLRAPQSIVLRLPHPDGRRASNVVGGTYDEGKETVVINAFTGIAEIRLEF
ncbi:glucosidase family protein [Cohnella abietis]|uniref:Uncharacterized protein n=1 Tax=Cohnella abietis TaxID=2507935 RepID=A0A3T1D3P2_9BACL|nr:hypothetical protein [Cohnella abietis]BBI32736.1 hypothetical protein KCTCHS21_21350 [Cohnella abietis]